MANLGPHFYTKLNQISLELHMKPEDLLSVMAFESGMKSDAKNPGGAVGLIQFMPDTLKGLGFKGTPEDFARLPGEDQLDWVAKSIKGRMAFQGGKPFTSGTQLYISNLWPVALKLPGVQQNDPSTIILERDPPATNGMSDKYLAIGFKIPAQEETAGYNGNSIFDHDHKGYITLGDMQKQISSNRKMPVYHNSVVALNQARKNPNTPSPTVEQSSHQLQPNMFAQEDQANTNNHSSGILGNLGNILERALQSILAHNSTHALKKLYGATLPKNQLVIAIKSPDYTSSLEFAHILSSALEEELLATAQICADGVSEVEVECVVHGDSNLCQQATQQLSQTIASSFAEATQKIGGIPVLVSLQKEHTSNYLPLNLYAAESHHRQFLLRFLTADTPKGLAHHG